MSDRQKLFYAILLSAFLHLAFGLILAVWTVQHAGDVAKALPSLDQLTVTIYPAKPTPPPQPAPVIVQPPDKMMRPVLDSDGLKASSKAPVNAAFQSDQNMAAGSQLPATTDLPLPSMSGPQRKFVDFSNQAASFGKGQTPAQAAHAARAAAASAPGTPKTAADQRKEAAQSTPTPKPAPSAAPDSLALGKPTPTPVSTPAEQLARLDLSPPVRGNASRSQPQPPSESQPEPSMQRETEQTQVNGGITVRGEPGVDAVETPFGRYHRKLSNLIGSRWKLYLQEHPKDVGDVTILVRINPDGKVAGTRVVANHSLDDLAELSTRAIMESNLPPVPDDLAPMLRDGKLEISFNFNVYDASNDFPGR